MELIIWLGGWFVRPEYE